MSFEKNLGETGIRPKLNTNSPFYKQRAQILAIGSLPGSDTVV